MVSVPGTGSDSRWRDCDEKSCVYHIWSCNEYSFGNQSLGVCTCLTDRSRCLCDRDVRVCCNNARLSQKRKSLDLPDDHLFPVSRKCESSCVLRAMPVSGRYSQTGYVFDLVRRGISRISECGGSGSWIHRQDFVEKQAGQWMDEIDCGVSVDHVEKRMEHMRLCSGT